MNPISWMDIWAWSDLTGTIVRPSEVRAIMAIDRVCRAEQAKADALKPK